MPVSDLQRLSPVSVLPVVLAGGVGSRLWPLSRQARPKQFLALQPGVLSMLQRTLERISALTTLPPYVVCGRVCTCVRVYVCVCDCVRACVRACVHLCIHGRWCVHVLISMILVS